MADKLNPAVVRMRTFARPVRKGDNFRPVRITVIGRSVQDCRDRIRAICRDYGLPVLSTLRRARRISRAALSR